MGFLSCCSSLLPNEAFEGICTPSCPSGPHLPVDSKTRSLRHASCIAPSFTVLLPANGIADTKAREVMESHLSGQDPTCRWTFHHYKRWLYVIYTGNMPCSASRHRRPSSLDACRTPSTHSSHPDDDRTNRPETSRHAEIPIPFAPIACLICPCLFLADMQRRDLSICRQWRQMRAGEFLPQLL